MDKATYTRVITALCLVACVGPIYMYVPMVFLGLIYLAGYGMTYEAVAMSYSNKTGYFCGFFVLIGAYVGYLYYTYMALFVFLSWLGRVLVMFSAWQPKRLKEALLLLGCIDVSLFTISFHKLYIADIWLLLFVMIAVSGIDSIAYFVGKRFGQHRIVPKISPNKTLEGYLGAAVWLLLLEGIFMIDNDIRILMLTMIFCMVYILAITGDLLVSFQKRILHVKDTGRFLPGHGGLLDRFDSWMFVVPFVCLIASIN